MTTILISCPISHCTLQVHSNSYQVRHLRKSEINFSQEIQETLELQATEIRKNELYTVSTLLQFMKLKHGARTHFNFLKQFIPVRSFRAEDNLPREVTSLKRCIYRMRRQETKETGVEAHASSPAAVQRESRVIKNYLSFTF